MNNDKQQNRFVSFNLPVDMVVPQFLREALKTGTLADNHFIRFRNHNQEISLLTFSGKPYISIGTDEGTDISIDVERGHIYSIDTEKKLPARFINSSLHALTKCLLLYKEYHGIIVNSSDQTIEPVLKELKQKFLDADPFVFSDEENWWDIIFFEIALGLS